MDEKLLRLLEEGDEEEVKKYIRSLPMGPHFRIKYCAERIMQLVDFMQLVKKHDSDLKHSANVALVNSSQISVSPESVLCDYVILEINNYYKHAKKLIDKGEGLPMPPTYNDPGNILNRFRNKMPGHRDDEERLSSIGDWMDLHGEVDTLCGTEKSNGFDTVLKDFKNYHTECLRIWGEVA